MTRLIILLSLFTLTALTACAQRAVWDRPPSRLGPYGYDEELPDFLNINGLTYHEARPLIIKAGWSPLQTLFEGTEEYEQGAHAGDAPKFWKKGYHELQTCTGGGMAYCSFLFQNKKGEKLRVVTKYEEWEEYSSYAEVVGQWLNPPN